MSNSDFLKRRAENREKLLAKIVKEFQTLDPAAIHLFGSGVNGFKDEFSDIDIWITIDDGKLKNTLNHLTSIYKSIAPILLKHNSKTWSPVGGRASSIIHEFNGDLFVVDYYISKLSETILPYNAKRLFGVDSITKGEWRLNQHVYPKMKDTHTLRKDVDLLLDLIFISYKGIIRQWQNDEFINTIKKVHQNIRQKYKVELPARRISLTNESNDRLLDDLYQIVNQRQKKVVNKIREFGRLVEQNYL